MPLIKTEKKEDEMRLIIHRTQGASNPEAIRTFSIYIELRLSKSFERSSLRSIPGFLEIFRE